MPQRDHKIEIDLARQSLQLLGPAGVIREYPVSTGKNGIGEQLDSGCTPRGRHSIAEMIGAGCPANMVFVGRQPTGEIYNTAAAQATPRTRLDSHPDHLVAGRRTRSLTGAVRCRYL